MKTVRPTPFDKQELSNDSEKHEVHVPTQLLLLSINSSSLLNRPHRRYTEIRVSSVGYCASNMACFDFVWDFIIMLKWRQNRWSRLRLRLTLRRSIAKQNTAFLPRIDKNYHVRGLSLGHLIKLDFFPGCYRNYIFFQALLDDNLWGLPIRASFNELDLIWKSQQLRSGKNKSCINSLSAPMSKVTGDRCLKKKVQFIFSNVSGLRVCSSCSFVF